jgi:hypothetical protein
MSRGASWFVTLAALTLIGVSLGSYLYHRRQLDSIAARHLRLAVTGPGELQVGMPCAYNLMTTTVAGEPCAAQVEWSLSTPDGKRLVDRKETTDERGRLTMIVPADMDLPTRSHGPAQLTVTAGGGASPLTVALPLPIRPARYLTRLWLDRRSYRAGETVYYRSLTVSRFSLAECRTLPVEFEILDSKSVPLLDSRIDGLTDHGVGNGSFRLGDSMPPGIYTLAARGLDDVFPEERLAFEVSGAATQSQAATDAKGLSDRRDPVPLSSTNAPGSATEAKEVPARSGSLNVDFFPEGGRLAAGIENRVYFAASDAKGRPLEVRGNVVDGKGASVTPVETARGGRGVFSITPQAAETYRLTITSPESSESPLLPPASADQKIAIATGRGVFAAGAPLEFTVRAAKERLPLVVTAQVRGMLVGQQLLVTSKAKQQAQAGTMSIPLDDQVAGVVRLTVYDYTQGPAKVLAERLVYRRPRSLVVRAAEGRKPADHEGMAPGISLSVQDGQGRPVAAALAATALDGAKDEPLRLARCGPDLWHAFLSDGALPDPAALEGVDLQLSDADDKAAALDLALGCQRPLTAEKPGDSGRAQAERDRPPLVLFDNLGDLQAQYEAALSEYRAQRTQAVNALIMLSFFGGLALALLVTMLALLRIVWGSRLWLPTVVATVCCVVVTAVSNEPSRMKAVEAAAVGFAPCVPPPEPGDEKRSEPVAATASSEERLRSLADKLSKMEGDAEALKADRFAVRQYVRPDSVAEPTGGDAAKPLAWYPLLIAGPDGRVTLPGLPPAAGQTLRLIIDAHGDGRIGSCELIVK